MRQLTQADSVPIFRLCLLLSSVLHPKFTFTEMSEQITPVASVTAATSDKALSTTKPAQTGDNDKAEESQAVAAFPINEFPDDELTHVLSWLKMHDMVSASRVNARWRRIALSTASLWSDVRMTRVGVGYTGQGTTIAARAKNTPIDLKINADRRRYPEMLPISLQKATKQIFRRHGHQIAALEFNYEMINCYYSSCSLPTTTSPIFEAAIESAKRAGMEHAPYWSVPKHASIRFPDFRTKRTVEFRHSILPCLMRFDKSTEVRLLDFEDVQRSTLDRVCAMFPNMTSLKIDSAALSFFVQDGALEYFLKHMSRVDKLSITTKLFKTQIDPLVGVLRWPVRSLEFDVSSSGNGFARQSRSVLRELMTGASMLTIRSIRQRNTTGEWKPKYVINIHVGSGIGRDFTFVHDNFPRAAQNYIAPLLREQMIQEVVIDGYAACALFYVACGTADLAHITSLCVVASEPDSIRVPQRELRLSGLRQLVLEKDPARSSRVSAATVEGLVSKLRTDGRVSLRLMGAYVYADGAPVNIEQYVDLVEGNVRSSSWSHVASSVT